MDERDLSNRTKVRSQLYSFLIIDDEAAVREGISENIDWHSHGYRLVGACKDGREGMRAIEEHCPDVVLTDICMPFVDGIELASFISERFPATKTILLTGYDEFGYAQEAVKLKVNDFLLKPITPDELRAILDRVRLELDEERRRELDVANLRNRLQESLPLLRERLLNRLLREKLTNEEIAASCSLIDLKLPGPAYTILALDPDTTDGSDPFRELQVEHAAREALAVASETSVVFHAPGSAITILVSGDDQLQALAVADEVTELVRVRAGISVSVGVGETVQSLSRIGDSYRDATAALSRRFLAGSGQILTVEQAGGSPRTGDARLEEAAREQVVRALRLSLFDDATSAVLDLVAVLRTRNTGVSECGVVLHRLLAEILGALDSLGVSYIDLPELSPDPFEKVVALKTLDVVADWIGGIIESARNLLSNRQHQLSVRKATEGRAYLDANFPDPKLSLTQVCRALAVSKSYFSPLFKSHTGMTFVEYLTALRIDRAKELLSTTDMKSYEIAARIGFTDAHYFSLTFRKQTGASPSEYRESARSGSLRNEVV